MNKFFVAIFAASLFAAGTAYAADPKIDAAVKTLNAVAADSAKLATYCEMSKEMAASGEKPTPASEAKIDGLIKKLGPDFESAWNVGEGLPENSPDAKALGAALDGLDQKCPG